MKPGDIIQIRPDAERWGGCLVIVTEVRSWGVVGFIPDTGGMVYVRVVNAEIAITGGMAGWTDDPHQLGEWAPL